MAVEERDSGNLEFPTSLYHSTNIIIKNCIKNFTLYFTLLEAARKANFKDIASQVAAGFASGRYIILVNLRLSEKEKCFIEMENHLLTCHHSFWPSLSGHLSLWHLSFRPSVLVLRVKGENLILSSFPCHQFGKRLSGRSNRRQKTFTAGDFSGELFRRRLFPHRKERLQETSNFSQTPEPENHPRACHAVFRPATASHAPAREGACATFRRHASFSSLA
ncbi:hypothetical protein CK203_084636 [Vitis vinifera]|uniref:Uncharacterized protein n=1 Tax=Vitis vinifera TaxID=29760 RepID=A0A438DKC1_VITVI|nr:hypothetical protein CK203_084636 [Vitis vinifera]